MLNYCITATEQKISLLTIFIRILKLQYIVGKKWNQYYKKAQCKFSHACLQCFIFVSWHSICFVIYVAWICWTWNTAICVSHLDSCKDGLYVVYLVQDLGFHHLFLWCRRFFARHFVHGENNVVVNLLISEM